MKHPAAMLLLGVGLLGCSATQRRPMPAPPPEVSPAADAAVAPESAADIVASPEPGEASLRRAPESAPTATDGPLSLEDAVALALERNPDFQAAAERIAEAEAKLGEATSAFYPQVGARLGFARTDNPAQAFAMILNQRRFNFDLDFNNPGPTQNVRPEIVGALPLFHGGQDYQRRQASALGVEAVKLERMAMRNALSEAVIGTYYALLAAPEQIDATRASVDAVSSALEQARTRLAAGTALKSDVLSLEVRIAEAREQLVRAENGAELARTGLRALLALPAEAPVQVLPIAVDPLPRQGLSINVAPALLAGQNPRPERAQGPGLQPRPSRHEHRAREDRQSRQAGESEGGGREAEGSGPVPDLSAPLDLGFADILARAVSARPELAAAARLVEIRDREVKAERAAYFPRVDAVASYGNDSSDFELSHNTDSWAVGVAAEIDLFSGFRTRERVRAAERRLEEARQGERKTRLEIEREVHTAYLSHQEAVQRYQVARAAVASAEDALRLVEVQYAAGTATITRYLEAEAARTSARSRAIAARFDLRRAEASLQKAMGAWAKEAGDV